MNDYTARISQWVKIPFEFRGDGAEYFRIWIVNLALTVLTLGIYSAWAKVRRMRYFYGNTLLDGHGFEYHAKPLQILKGRVIVVGALVLVYGLAYVAPPIVFLFIPIAIFGIPWIIQKARTFQMRVTSYRNLRFNFHGNYGGALSAFVGWYILTAVTLGILFPAWLHRRVRYTLDNAAYGTTPFRFTTTSGEFFAFCIATGLMSAVAYTAFFYLTADVGIFYPSADAEVSIAGLFASLGVGGLLGLLVVGAAGMGIWGYYQARFANAAFGGIQIGEARVLSDVKAWPLAWIEMTNLLGMVFTLGLFYPWAAVRKMRYQLENTAFETPGNLQEFQAAAGEPGDVLGEELGEFLDVDFGI